jgi:hypothetical protein
MSNITLRFAETDEDVVAIHAFLCIVAGPMLPGPIDPQKSATEVWRIVNQECAIMACDGALVVGSLGIIKVDPWWGNKKYLVNRWFHALPAQGIGALLLYEGDRFAKEVGLELHIFDEAKGRLLILNRDPARKSVNPMLVQPKPVEEARVVLH